MSRDIGDTIEINASPATAWATFTDTGSFAAWNPFLGRVDGELRPQAKLDVQIQPPGARALSFKPTVLVIEPERELRWIGHLIVPGLFDGEHSFRLEPLGSGGAASPWPSTSAAYLSPSSVAPSTRPKKGLNR